MANEITLTQSVTISNGLFKDRFQPGPIQIDQATIGGGNPGEVIVGTSSQDIDFGDAAPGLVCVQNLDGTNYVEYGPKSGGAMIPFGKIDPGKCAFF